MLHSTVAKSGRVVVGEGDVDDGDSDEVMLEELIDVVGEDPVDSDAVDIEPIGKEGVGRGPLNEKTGGLGVERVVGRKGGTRAVPSCKKTDKAATR